jgi:hypothetical protein
MIIQQIPGVLVTEWKDEVKAMFDTWSNYAITVDQFREAILEKGVAHARSHGGRAWVVDSQRAEGAFPQDLQKVIEAEVFKTFASIGIKYFITIKSDSAITNMSIKRYSAHAGPHGLQLVEVPSQSKAIEWLNEHP